MPTEKGDTMPLIAYDQPITDLIAGLNATKHVGFISDGQVIHQHDTKTMVTFHHNGGIFTAQEVLDIWKSRPASAHFDVDKDGQLAQFADVHDYAWACTNRYGNETSISIELSNSTTSPDWLVDIDTWRKGARLAGWLFANVINAEPTTNNVVFHHHWYPTACAGPYMDKVYTDLVDAVHGAWGLFKTAPPKPAPAKPAPRPPVLVEDGRFGVASIEAWQRLAGTTQDGLISGQPETTKPYQPALLNVQYQRTGAKGSQVIAWVQKRTGATQDGLYGPGSIKATQRHVGVKADGYFGPHTARAVQHALNEGKF